MTKDIQDIINHLGLQPHPEGGFFKEVYRSEGNIPQHSLSPEYAGDRNYATSIYFLLTSETFSAFHRIRQDEIWHFYKGTPIKLHTINSEGIHAEHSIGNSILNNQQPQLVVKGGDWFAAEIIDQNSYALVGCTVAPGFSFEDFELPKRAELIERFPQHEALITRLTHN